ncbi:uncharacterized protein [Montipora capricornis]|uniref:uncharacterized protein n=1 Tax=Montipora capricornis TaxID=246305 RepID=UPI0035F14846
MTRKKSGPSWSAVNVQRPFTRLLKQDDAGHIATPSSRNLNGTQELGLLYSRGEMKDCVGYSDADWIDLVTFFRQEEQQSVGLRKSVFKNPCLSLPCHHGGTCVPRNKYGTFTCTCKPGFIGGFCKKVVRSFTKSQFYFSHFSKSTFHYDSAYWINKVDINVAGGETGFDSSETKLPTYWNTPFSRICLGMKIGQALNFIDIAKQAVSLYSLIADRQYRATSLGRHTWKMIIGSQASLPVFCNMEGFNGYSGASHSRARIGILGNEKNDCLSPDSRIGFGTGGYPEESTLVVILAIKLTGLITLIPI